MSLSFSSLIIYKLLFSALLLFLLFRIIIFAIPLIIKKSAKRKFFERNIPLIEFFSWLLFSIWTFKNLLEKNQYFAIVMFVVMLTIAIFSVRIFLKDYIAGIIVKADTSIVMGDTITTSNYTGIIKKFNYRTLELELTNKNIVKIPFSNILNNNLLKEQKSYSNSAYTFEITILKNKDIENIINSIKQSIILLPWSLTTQSPIIKLINEKKNTYTLSITVFSHKKDMYFKIEKHIKDKFSL